MPDSLIIELERTYNKERRLEILWEIVKKTFKIRNPDTTIYFAKKQMDLAEMIGDKNRYAGAMWKIAYWAIIAYVLISLLYVLLHLNGNNPSFGVLIMFFAVQFFSVGFIFGNMRALAMQPLGHIAGIGSAINGFVSTVMAVPIANYIGSFVNDSVLPLFIGFSVFGILSFLTFLRVKVSKT